MVQNPGGVQRWSRPFELFEGTSQKRSERLIAAFSARLRTIALPCRRRRPAWPRDLNHDFSLACIPACLLTSPQHLSCANIPVSSSSCWLAAISIYPPRTYEEWWPQTRNDSAQLIVTFDVRVCSCLLACLLAQFANPRSRIFLCVVSPAQTAPVMHVCLVLHHSPDSSLCISFVPLHGPWPRLEIASP